MPRYNDYDDYTDLVGLDDFSEAIVSPAMVRDSVIAAGASAGALLGASWLVPTVLTDAMLPAAWDAPTKSRVRALAATLLGLVAGRFAWNYNRDAAMAIIGGVAGLGIAQLVDSFFDRNFVGSPFGVLPEDIELSGDEALLRGYDYGPALANLETTGVNSASGAFADPTVTPEALFGFQGTVVQNETLGGYQPYLA